MADLQSLNTDQDLQKEIILLSVIERYFIIKQGRQEGRPVRFIVNKEKKPN
jgi:hypothetical protein